MPAANIYKATLDLDRETKGAVRYQERGEDVDSQALRTVYIRKSAFNGEIPESVTVTIAKAGK